LEEKHEKNSDKTDTKGAEQVRHIVFLIEFFSSVFDAVPGRQLERRELQEDGNLRRNEEMQQFVERANKAVKQVAEELGFADQDGTTLTGLFRQKYRGGRYSWGYPACPRLEDNALVVELLGADRIGVEVSEGFQLHPEQSTTAIVCHHPQAKYFIVRRTPAGSSPGAAARAV